MSRLAAIPVRVESLPAPAGSPAAVPVTRGIGPGGIDAVLAELAGLVERLAAEQVASTIDLRSLPLSPEDRIELQRVLGTGEVHVTLTAGGESTLCDTSIPGIWWTQHHDAAGAPSAELIEVTRIPPILVNDPGELAGAGAALRALMAARRAATV